MKRKRMIVFDKEHLNQHGTGMNYSWTEVTDSTIHNVIYSVIEQMRTKGQKIDFNSFKSDVFGHCKIVVKCDKPTFVDFAHKITLTLGHRITEVRW